MDNQTITRQILDRWIVITFITLVFSMFLFEISDIDIIIQQSFYNFNLNQWILDRNNAILEFIFYDGIKKALVIFAIIVAISLLFFGKNRLVQSYRTGLLIVVFCAILIPSVVGILKVTTNTPCPKNITRFNGCYPYVKVFSTYPPTFHQKEKIECFPAGHASGGFALFSLFFLFKSRKNRRKALLFAMITGWSMGLYKMLIGDHFLSHTVVSMILAWLITLIVARVVSVFTIEKNST